MKTCFVISTIGSMGSPERKKADALLNKVIRPILEEKLHYKVVRADEIAEPKQITKSIIEHLEDDDLVIADVHDENPNVFYELGLRNAVNKPYILFRDIDQLPPFDIAHKRAIQNPFSVNIEIEDGAIQEAKVLLKKFVIAAEQKLEDASESIASRYLKLTKIKKHFKITVSLFSVTITIVSVMLSFLILFPSDTLLDPSDKSILDNQIKKIESTTYTHISNVIRSTTNIETLLVYMYELEKETSNKQDFDFSIPDFVEKLEEHGVGEGIFVKNYLTTPVSAYVYIMKDSEKCEFVAYAWLDDMNRDGIGDILESCTLTKEHDLVITNVYPSTGTVDYVFAIAKVVDFESDDSKSDLIVSTAVKLPLFSEKIKNEIYLEDVRFVLTNKENEIVFDCSKNICPVNYETKAQNEGDNFNKNSTSLTYSLDNFPNYFEYHNVDLVNEKLSMKIDNSILVNGWKLRVLISENSSINTSS